MGLGLTNLRINYRKEDDGLQEGGTKEDVGLSAGFNGTTFVGLLGEVGGNPLQLLEVPVTYKRKSRRPIRSCGLERSLTHHNLAFLPFERLICALLIRAKGSSELSNYA